MDTVPLSVITGEALLGLQQDRWHGIHLIGSFAELQAIKRDLFAGAVHELCGFRSASPLVARFLEVGLSASDLPTTGATGHPLLRRITYDPSVLDLPNAGACLSERAAGGEQMRFLSGLSASVMVADGHRALVDLTSYDSSGRGSVLVTDRRMVLALGALSDMIWTMAVPMSEEGALTLGDRTRHVLDLLSAGLSDAAIADQLRVSQRTVERTVRSLMERLGATTRFQAGVLAGRRGFI